MWTVVSRSESVVVVRSTTEVEREDSAGENGGGASKMLSKTEASTMDRELMAAGFVLRTQTCLSEQRASEE
jgi:hypothetical protein